MEFSFSQNNEVIRFFDKNDKPISVLGNCSKFVYQLNELGFRKSLHFLDSNNKPVENSWNIYEYTWEYLDNGAVIEDRFNGQGKQVSIRPGFEFYKLRLYFNHAGHITLMQNIDKDGNLVENSSGASQDNITTNSDGNFLQWQVLNNQHQLEKGNGPNIAIGIQTFNEFGYEIALEHRDENNQPIYNTYGICRSRTSFDKFGNLAGRRFYNEQNEPSNHQIAGYHQLKIIWDTSGNNRASLSYYDTNGQPTHHATRGYHAVKYAYDKSNKLIKVSYLDTRGNLINRKDNKTAYITYQYNNDGTQTSIQRFDNQGIALNQ
jgi:YD repeat-containing protein